MKNNRRLIVQNVIEKLKEIDSNEVGIIIYSIEKRKKVSEFNSNLLVPLASAAKIAVGFCITKWVEEKLINWNDIVEDICFNPKEDSKELYPHFQHRKTLLLQDAVEIMIACHDSFVANRIVQMCGGWEEVNKKVKSYFLNINITQNPRDKENNGYLCEMFELMLLVY